MDWVAPVISGLFLLLYVAGIIALAVYVVLLLRRQALAQERIANAVERMAAASPGTGGAPSDHSGAGASA